jgi:hypothetical protein
MLFVESRDRVRNLQRYRLLASREKLTGNNFLLLFHFVH